MKTALQQQFDLMASGIIRETIQPKADVVAMVQNQNILAQNVMLHILNVFKFTE